MVEAFGTLGYHGRTGEPITRLLERQVSALLPHSGVALTHGLALLRAEPPEPLGLTKITTLIGPLGLLLELSAGRGMARAGGERVAFATIRRRA